MTPISPALALQQLAHLLDLLDGEALLQLHTSGGSHLWRVAPGVQAPVLPPPTAVPDVPWHREDFRQVRWPGLGPFTLSPKQAAVVRALWQAWHAGRLPVDQRELLQAAGSDCPRLADLFKRSPAWGTLLLIGEIPGTYTLPPPAGPAAD